MKTSECLWCGKQFTYEKNDVEHLAQCQAQLNWPIAEFNEATGKSYLAHPDYPNVRFERISLEN